ncbi:hypothetical protein ONS95_013631 [Cadophora gregata]|uniref:uncharacterized protein n=1 Tax=Cadophora gregata TaxID=51156 RepID=UPI0026DB116E|nr:uncharacterized protein ONS95_013631 [Cadophora gregata]KAK0114129.1 hypothetical protein ONS95_013631 [Cadophora gregata]
MALAVSLPVESVTRESFSSLYILLKSSIAVVEAANIHSLEVVQSRLLMCLFEVGHAIEPTASISLGTTARAAVAIGLKQTLDCLGSTSQEAYSITEVCLRVWWGIVMLDRWYTIERGDRPCATQNLGPPQHLPRDGGRGDENALPLSTPSSVRVGPFSRQAQVPHILDILVMHLRNHKVTKRFNAESVDQIAKTLTSFSMLLPEESPEPWPRYCGAIGMCYSALMTIYEPRPCTALSVEFTRSDAPESLKSALARIRLLPKKFNGSIEKADCEAISPFPPHSLAKAAIMHYRLWSEASDNSHIEAADSLLTMIKHFSKRWDNAAKHVARLEEVRRNFVPSDDSSSAF